MWIWLGHLKGRINRIFLVKTWKGIPDKEAQGAKSRRPEIYGKFSNEPEKSEGKVRLEKPV